ncbi:hypothetical protein COOONC_21884, partial [Cooperia oncophora]
FAFKAVKELTQLKAEGVKGNFGEVKDSTLIAVSCSFELKNVLFGAHHPTIGSSARRAMDALVSRARRIGPLRALSDSLLFALFANCDCIPDRVVNGAAHDRLYPRTL